jgi:hypothetical protein
MCPEEARTTKRLWTVVVACISICAATPVGHALAPAPSTSREDIVAQLLKELRWKDDASSERYSRVRDEVTARVLREIDRYVSETAVPGNPASLELRERLDRLLGHIGRDDTRGTIEFSVNLSNGRFLLIGVEISRGGRAIAEDVISFRAYKDVGNRFVHVADIELPVRDMPEDRSRDWPLVSVNARPVTSQPVGNEFWFLAWACVPPRSPYTVIARLYGFDGVQFRTVWTVDEFITRNVFRAIQVTPDGGFVLQRMPDFRGGKVITDHYAVSADGPQKVAETETEPR